MNDVVKEKKKMGRKPSLSPDEIIETIKDLQNENRDITPCTIRREIGHGGLGNINAVMESFLKNQTGISIAENSSTESHILAPDLEDKVNMLISDLSLQLNHFALESDLLANNIAEKRARSAYETMIDNNRKLVDEQALTIKIFDEVETKNEELNEKITEIETRLENEQVKSAALDKSLSKAADESTRLNVLISETRTNLSTSEAKNKSLEKLITKIETRLEDALKDKDISVNESTQLRTQLMETSTKFESSEAIVVQLKSEINALRTENAQSISDLQSTNLKLLSELKEIRTEQQANKEKLITITTQFSAQKDVLKEKDGRITDLKKQLTELKAIK
jgi:DNA repair exonuclease SbcCD ATPase subunit